MNFSKKHLYQTIDIIKEIDVDEIEKIANILSKIKSDGGRLFFLELGVVPEIARTL